MQNQVSINNLWKGILDCQQANSPLTSTDGLRPTALQSNHNGETNCVVNKVNHCNKSPWLVLLLLELYCCLV
jgi:hypothetical protein